MAFTTKRSYVGVQVTLADHTKTYLLLDLIDAVIAAETLWDGSAVCGAAAKQMYLQNPSTNAGSIWVGDALLVAAGAGRCSAELVKSAVRGYGTGDCNSVDLGQMYVTSATDNDKLNVEVMVG